MPGTYDVQMRAHIPGLGVVLESNTLTLELDCSDNPTVSPDPDEEEPDEQEPDGEESPVNPPADVGDKEPPDGGCSVASGADASPLALLGFLFGVRRYSRRDEADDRRGD